MIGTLRVRGRCRIRAAVSNPSISGMLTSRRMTATSWSRRKRSASRPDSTATTFSPSSVSTDSTANRCAAVSSTMRMLTRSPDAGGSGARSLPPRSSVGLIGLPRSAPTPPSTDQPRPQHRDELLGIDRLGEIVPGAGLAALLSIALHGLGGDRDDRHVTEPRIEPDLSPGLHAVHLRPHAVPQHHVTRPT